MASLFQFSVRNMLVTVTIACIGIAALLNANAWWEAFAWLAALLIFSCGLLLIVYRREETRAFWLGFVVFGGAYLALLLYSFTADWKNDQYSNNPLHYNSLATTKLLVLAYESALPDSRRREHVSLPAAGANVAHAASSDPELVTGPDGRPVNVGFSDDVSYMALTRDGGSRRVLAAGIALNPGYIPPSSFISIGQALWLLFIAAVGGKTCRWIYRSRPSTTNGIHSVPG